MSSYLAGKSFLESLRNPKFIKMKLNRLPGKQSMNIVNHNKSTNINSNVRVCRIMFDGSKDGEVYLKLAGIEVLNMGGLYIHIDQPMDIDVANDDNDHTVVNDNGMHIYIILLRISQ